jgi:hypothetical protein
MNSEDAEQLMMPFFPHDPYLAIQSLSRTLFEEEGFRLPEWIWEAVVQQFFTYLMVRRLTLKQEHMRDQLNAKDPFKMMTVPLLEIEKPSMN